MTGTPATKLVNAAADSVTFAKDTFNGFPEIEVSIGILITDVKTFADTRGPCGPVNPVFP